MLRYCLLLDDVGVDNRPSAEEVHQELSSGWVEGRGHVELWWRTREIADSHGERCRCLDASFVDGGWSCSLTLLETTRCSVYITIMSFAVRERSSVCAGG